MLITSKLAVSLILGLSLLAAPALAQGPSNDPAADSPAGVIYELPLDRARVDAAPRRPSGGTGAPSGGKSDGGAGAARPKSSIHSENGFGSSSTVPGAPGSSDDGGEGGSGGGAGSGGGGTGTGGGSGSDTGGGSGDSAAKDDAATSAQTSGSDGGPSELGVYGLLALVLVAGLAAGLITRGRGRDPASS